MSLFSQDRRTRCPKIALVVATYNRAGALDRFLAHAQAQQLATEDFEVVVAVDGSTDRTLQLLDEWKRRGSLPLVFFWQENTGQAGARHSAVLRSRSPRIVVVDDDMEFAPNFLSEHLRAAEREENAVVIGKVLPAATWRSKPLYEAVREHHMLLLHRRLEEGTPPSAVAFVTQNVSFPRRLYLEVGGFDPDFRIHEDVELGLRCERAGGKFVFAPRAWAIHHSDVGSYETWERRQYEYGRMAVRTWEKHHHDPLLHPLRNYVTGSRLNRAVVLTFGHSDLAVRTAVRGLRVLGPALQKVGLFEPAIATHKAIIALQFHLGVKHALGSWREFTRRASEFARLPGRPRDPIGQGRTNRGLV